MNNDSLPANNLMYHHDDRDRATGVSEAAKKMRERLDKNIAEAKKSSMAALMRIQEEVPDDRVILAPKMVFEVDDAGKAFRVDLGGAANHGIHKWGFGQMTEYAGIPKSYIQSLVNRRGEDDAWGPELAVENLNKLFKHMPDKRLVRSVGEEVRGFLSSKYARRHPGKMLDMFIGAATEHGLLAYRAQCTDTKHMVRAVLNRVIEPVRDEVIGVGVVYAESPYGNGATELSINIERMWCSNTAIVETSLRSVHIGGQLSENMTWSDETYQKATETTISQVKDMLATHVGEASIKRLEATIRLAHETKIDRNNFETFLKKNFSKDEGEQIKEHYRSTDVEMLPAGDSYWRASNALSFFAKGPQLDEERQFEVQKLAGNILSPITAEVAKRRS